MVITEEKPTEVMGIESEDISHNIIDIYIDEILKKFSHRLGTVFPETKDREGRYAYTHLTYKQMNEEVNQYAHGFIERGIKPGDRVLLLIRPSLEFTLVFGTLVKIGAIPILIDPGMGIRPMLKSIRLVEPDVFFGIPLAHLARIFAPKYWKSVRLSVTVNGKRWFWGGPKLEDMKSDNKEDFPIYKAKKDDKVGIFFTTGSTGIPKGVVYTHGMFHALAETVKETFRFEEGSIDMPAFPPMALFCMAFGGTSIIPDMDPTQPAKADPEKLIQQIEDFGINISYGSPAIWNRLSDYCIKNKITLPTMHYLFMFGCPIPGKVLENFRKIMPNGEVFTPYGATEALFVSNISANEVCDETLALSREGKGTCVGRAINGIDLRIINITDEKITLPNGGIEELTVPNGNIGEIIVRGDYITREYYNMPEKTIEGKIYDHGTVWHRMGDLGYLDDKNRLWFVGRKKHRINRNGIEYYSVMMEAHFNHLEGVRRSAMVGIPCKTMGQRMVIIIEANKGEYPCGIKNKKRREKFLFDYCKEKDLLVDAILFKKAFPVDIRHNAKIRREILSNWAEKKLKGRFE
ncbi:MAG: fatty acid CoA ligase family protein [Promethearchaeota archaeon]